MPAKKPAKKVEKTKELAKVAPDMGKKEVWAGMTGVTGARTADDAKNTELIMTVGQAFGIPPIGINILGGKPYINKDGLLYKIQQYSGRRKKGMGRLKGIRKEFIQYAIKPTDVSVVKATLEFDDGTFVEGIGEASSLNVSLDKVKASLNMMAETRAVNRAIRQVITFELWEEAMTRFAGLDLKPEERALIEESVTISAEEIENKPAKKAHEVAEKTPETSLSATISRAIEKATDKATLETLRGKIELSDKLSEPAKQMLIPMIEAKLKTL